MIFFFTLFRINSKIKIKTIQKFKKNVSMETSIYIVDLYSIYYINP